MFYYSSPKLLCKGCSARDRKPHPLPFSHPNHHSQRNTLSVPCIFVNKMVHIKCNKIYFLYQKPTYNQTPDISNTNVMYAFFGYTPHKKIKRGEGFKIERIFLILTKKQKKIGRQTRAWHLGGQSWSLLLAKATPPVLTDGRGVGWNVSEKRHQNGLKACKWTSFTTFCWSQNRPKTAIFENKGHFRVKMENGKTEGQGRAYIVIAICSP